MASTSEDHEHVCDKCEVHLAWEEKMKVLEQVPDVLTWINQEKGKSALAKFWVPLVVGIVFTLSMTYFQNISAAAREEMGIHKIECKGIQTTTTNQIELITKLVQRIDKNVDVMTTTYALTSKEAEKERTENKHAIQELRAVVESQRTHNRR